MDTINLIISVVAHGQGGRIDSETAGVAGEYVVTLSGDTPMESWGSAAIDGLHMHVPDISLEHFEIAVRTENAFPVDDPTPADSYSLTHHVVDVSGPSHKHSCDLLEQLASSIDANWNEREAIDWSEAEQLARHCAALHPATLASTPNICQIVDYAASEDDWDCDYVGGWPALIAEDLAQVDIAV